MNKIWCCLLLIVFSITSATAQTISKNWQLNSAQDVSSQKQTFGEATEINFKEGRFEFLDASGKDTLASGDYLYQNKLLVLFYNTPLVDGKIILSGSLFTAILIALANALKMASIL